MDGGGQGTKDGRRRGEGKEESGRTDSEKRKEVGKETEEGQTKLDK